MPFIVFSMIPPTPGVANDSLNRKDFVQPIRFAFFHHYDSAVFSTHCNNLAFSDIGLPTAAD